MDKCLVPLISCDYVYISPTGVFERDKLLEHDRAGALKVPVAYCGATRSLFAHTVPRKGVDQDGYIVDQFKRDAHWLGHTKVMIRSDNEPAMLQVVEKDLGGAASCRGWFGKRGIGPLRSANHGASKNAVRLLKGTLRTNLLSPERQLRARIPLDHPILAWLVLHSASIRAMRVNGTRQPYGSPKGPRSSVIRQAAAVWRDLLVQVPVLGKRHRSRCVATEHWSLARH